MNLTNYLVVINEYTNEVWQIEENIKNAGSKIKLIVYNNFCTNNKIIDDLKSYASTWIENKKTAILPYSECVNEMLRICSEKYICLDRSSSLYSENWLKKLIDYNQNIQFSGVSSILNYNCDETNYLLNKDNELELVYVDSQTNNFAFFKKELLFKIGGFNTKFHGRLAFNDFCKRSSKMGFVNYSVPNTSKITDSIYTDFFKNNESKSELILVQKDFVVLYAMSESDIKNIADLSKKFGDKFSYHEQFGSIIFQQKDPLDGAFLIELLTELENINLKLTFYSSGFFENDLLKLIFIGIIEKIK